MMERTTAITKPVYSRRRLLAFSAAGGATAALAACGGSAVPTTTPAPTVAAAPTTAGVAATVAGPAATATAVPQSFGGAATAPAATTAATTAPTVAAAATTGAAPTVAAAAPTTAATAAGAAQPAKPANLADKQVFRFATGPYSDGLDPAIITDPVVTISMFEGVINVNPADNTFEAAMAESYSSNADATVWTFKIRPNLKWSDGMPLTAKDFEYSWRRVMDPATKSKYTSSLYGIKNAKDVETGKVPPDQLGVKAVNDTTFEVTLNEPTPFFPLIASTWTCLPTPQQAIAKLGDKWTNGPNVVSNGPFVLKEWKQDQSLTFEPNPNYFGTKPYLTQVLATQYDDVLAKGAQAYENNELDDAQVAAGDFDRVKGNAALAKQLKAWPGSSTYWYTLDCTNKPTDDVKVRQALYLGFDRKTLIDTVLKGYYTDAPTMLPPDIPGYNPMAVLTGGVEKAKQLLADAGFPNGQGFPTDFTFVYSTGTAATQKPILEFLQGEYKKNLGINVQISAMETKAFSQFRVDRQKGMKFNAAQSNWGSDYGDPSNWHNQLFASNAAYYGSHWKDDAFDQLVAKAKSTPDKDARVKMYQQAEQIFVQSASHMTLYHGQSFFLSRPTLQGVYHPPILGSTAKYKYIYYTK